MLFAYTAFIQNCKSICLENCANIVWEILFATSLSTKLKVFASEIAKIVAGKYHWPHTNIFQRIFGLKSCNLHCNRRMIYPYIACLWSSKRMWWFRWNMSPQFGKRNVSKKHQLFSKEIELSGWYILPLKTDPCAYYWRSFFFLFDNSDSQCGFRVVITLFDIFWYIWQFRSSTWVL